MVVFGLLINLLLFLLSTFLCYKFTKKALLTRKLGLLLRKKLLKCYIWSIALYDAKIWTFRKSDQKYLETSEMWCWRTIVKISWTDHMRNEEMLHSQTGKIYPTNNKN